MSELIKPNFFIVGAPKCGTSSLINTLRWHPNIWVPLSFEPQYFSTDFGTVTDHTDDSYMEMFAGASDKHMAIGEKSVIYLYSSNATANILKFNPDARFIVMLRNPVDLVYSWHSQLYYTFIEEIEDFGAAWDAQEERQRGENIPERCKIPLSLQYREIGKLGKYYRKLLEDVPEGRLLTVFMEDFHTDADAVYRSTLEFLGVPYEPRRDPRRLNVNKRHRSRRLGKVLAHDTYGSRTAKFIRSLERRPIVKHFPIKYWLHEFNKVEYKRKPLDSELRRQLLEEFREDIGELGELTNRDLSHWLN